mgnify:CR=1 FL=1
MDILSANITDKNILSVLQEIIQSFDVKNNKTGLPLGNLTSQLFANVYMNEFDQFVKHKLKVRHYIRYADDFVILSENKIYVENLIPVISHFLNQELQLQLHQNKVFIKTLNSGVDFLGWVHFFDHRVLRTMTKRRMFKRIQENPKTETINSYLGLLGHGNSYKIKNKIIDLLSLVFIKRKPMPIHAFSVGCSI